MSLVKRLFHVRKFRTIVALASVLGIIFLSWMIIDKDNSIAQTLKSYVATSYIKIEDYKITKEVGVKSVEYGVRDSLERTRKENGDFTLIEIKVGGKSLYILASDVCVCKVLQDPVTVTYKDPKGLLGPQLEQMNQGLEEKFVQLEVPDSSCRQINERWI